MSKCYVTGSYVEWYPDCDECRTRSCPINTCFAEDPLPDDDESLADKNRWVEEQARRKIASD